MNDTAATFTPYQKFVIAILSLLQFTVIVDFMVTVIMMYFIDRQVSAKLRVVPA